MIVDEFAELLAARPEFIDLFVGLGRVGRSLGIHLLLSSQRLDEGRLRGLESHLRYRLCLRTYSATESKLVLGTPDAYLLPSLPGLGYLKVDTETLRAVPRRARLRPARARRRRRSAAPPPVRVFERRPRRRAAARPRPAPRRPTGRASCRCSSTGSTRRPAARAPGVGRAAAGGRAARRACSPTPPWWRGGERAEGLRAARRPARPPGRAAHRAVRARPRRRRRPRRGGRLAAHRQEHAAAHARRRADPAPHARRRCRSTAIDLGGGLLERARPARRTSAASPASSTARR